MLTAIVMLNITPAKITTVGKKVAAIDGVAEVYSTTGEADLFAIVRVSSHDEIAKVISDQIAKVEGVEKLITHLAFRTYSREDLDAAFDIGLD